MLFGFSDGVRSIPTLPLTVEQFGNLIQHYKKRGGLLGTGGSRALRRSFATNNTAEPLIDPQQASRLQVRASPALKTLPAGASCQLL